MAIPALFAVLGLALWAVSAAGLRMDCTDAARSGARAAARGDPDTVVQALVARVGPRGARLDVERRDGFVTVTVSKRTAPPGPIRLPGVTVVGTAVAELER